MITLSNNYFNEIQIMITKYYIKRDLKLSQLTVNYIITYFTCKLISMPKSNTKHYLVCSRKSNHIFVNFILLHCAKR